MSRRNRRLVVPALLGLAGSTAVALAGASVLRGRPVQWWISGTLLSPVAARVTLLVGLLVLCLAWLALGRWGDRPPDLRVLAGIGAGWSVPLALGPPLFSQDAYSYLAQGLLAHLGLDPYRHASDVLAGLGHPGVLAAVSPFWRHTTAPYGPGFLGLAGAVAAVAASHLELSVLLLRIPELAGLGLIAAFAPRVARRCGGDPARALWLAAISPLALIERVAAGHNDGLMAGLLVAGLSLALGGRTAWAIAVCALAATVKLPAAAALPFVVVAGVRARPERGWSVALLEAAGVTAAVIVLVTLAAGLGPDWLSRGVLSTPGLVRLATTPATDVGWVVAHVLRAFGAHVGERSLELAAGKWVLLIPAAIGAALLRRVRRETLVACVALVLLALATLGPAAWPWYLIWGVCLLACLPAGQAGSILALLVTAPVFLIYADGRLRLPLSAAPWVLAVYLLGALVLARRAVRGPAPHRLSPPSDPTAPTAPTTPAAPTSPAAPAPL